MLRNQVLVLGAGVAGLSAALRLARRGYEVTVVEKRGEAGGRAISHRSEGFTLNLGPHALYQGGYGARALKELKISFKGSAPVARGMLALSKGEHVMFPASPLSFARSSLLRDGGRLGLLRAFTRVMRASPEEFAHESFKAWVERNVPEVGARAILYVLGRLSTYCCAADQISAQVALEQLKQALYPGVMYLDHGWQSMVDGLMKAGRDAGVSFVLGSGVVSVERGDDRWRVSLRDGGELLGDSVVVALPLKVAARLLGDRAGLKERAAEARPIYMSCLDVSLRTLPNPDCTALFGVEDPLYLSVHSASARLAPKGGAVVHVARYLESGEVAGGEDGRGELEALLESVQPGWREHVVEVQYLPRMMVACDLDTAARGGFHGRAPVAPKDSPGLFFAGDWVGGRGLLCDASFASAEEAASEVHRFLDRAAHQVA